MCKTKPTRHKPEGPYLEPPISQIERWNGSHLKSNFLNCNESIHFLQSLNYVEVFYKFWVN